MAERHPASISSELQSKMRHDLRNPLNAIKGYAELLLEELDEFGAPPSVPISRHCSAHRTAFWRGST